MTTAPDRDIFRPVLGIAVIGGLIALSFWIVRPFLPALIWATMIVAATWPLFLRLEKRLKGKRWLAVTVMTIALLLVFVIPFTLALLTLVNHLDDIVEMAKSLETTVLGEPPDWVANLPMVGEKIDAYWRQVIAEGGVGGKLSPYMGALVKWFAAQIGGFGAVAIQFLLTVVIAAILFARGEAAAGMVLRFARRLADERGDSAVRLAGQAIRGVALGVVVTALIQSIFGGIGLLIAGVPFAAILTAGMFMLAVAQIGAAPVLLGATVYTFYRGETGWAVALLVWTIVVGSMDNVIRPILIRRGVHLPLLLIFAGVIGGLVAFGLVGLFIGPIALAVTFRLMEAWVAERVERPEAALPTP